MPLGIYVHIPYCIQRCHYCDFATYEQYSILPPNEYVELLLSEIQLKSHYYLPRTLSSLYFGGGTPSLIPAELIVTIIKELEKHGFILGPGSECTIEINPYTIDPLKLEVYLKAGVNRFSVGAQTFNDALLKKIGREHNSQQTIETLKLLKGFDLNYNFDILFALPNQSLQDLRDDLRIAMTFSPPHISPYCLTIPEGHSLTPGRPIEDHQVEMFDEIERTLTCAGYKKYEISNYAKLGRESKHNLLYWTDEEYWGLGLSAHSYIKRKSNTFENPWGMRYWNVRAIGEYKKQILSLKSMGYRSRELGAGPQNELPSEQLDILSLHSALTDFCHTSLRLSRGLSQKALIEKFTQSVIEQKVFPILDRLRDNHLIQFSAEHFWSLTAQGQMISNQVFEKLTFLPDNRFG